MSSRKRKPRKGITEAISVTLPKTLISRMNTLVEDGKRSLFVKQAIEHYIEVSSVHSQS